MNSAPGLSFELESAKASDFEDLLALRLRAMRASLEQIGRYDEERARERLAANWAPEHTRHIVVDGHRIGFVVLKRLSHVMRLNHLYIDPPAQRRGIGGRVLEWACTEADRAQLPIELCAIKGSAANGFYLSHGFVEIGEGEWDVDYVRMPRGPGIRAVRALWAAIEARDWAGARALLRDDLEVRWWTSGERYEGAGAYIEVNARYPEGWTTHLLEVSRLDDGRVLSLVRVDHGSTTCFATSIFRIDDERIAGIDEYRATVEAPPAWRAEAHPPGLPGRGTFDPRIDPRAAQR